MEHRTGRRCSRLPSARWVKVKRHSLLHVGVSSYHRPADMGVGTATGGGTAGFWVVADGVDTFGVVR
jgi:hypothetical protein